jgi:hypothetical protein
MKEKIEGRNFRGLNSFLAFIREPGEVELVALLLIADALKTSDFISQQAPVDIFYNFSFFSDVRGRDTLGLERNGGEKATWERTNVLGVDNGALNSQESRAFHSNYFFFFFLQIENTVPH